MKDKIVLIGGGGHCKSCIDVIESTNQYEIVGIIDKALLGQKVLGYPVIGTDEELPEIVKEYKNYAITIGQIETSKIRRKVYSLLKEIGGQLPVIVASSAYISESAVLDEGTIVFHHSTINSEAKIGKCCIVNSQSLIEHESMVGDFSHVSTGSILNGQVILGESCFVGSGSVLRNNININSNTFIRMGSVVKKDI